MDDRGSLPKHMQISEMLVREIAAGRLADGARLKPEREMAAEFGVAVGTLRRALDELTEKGLLERVQGSGNYVRHLPDARSVYTFFRLEVPGGGGLPTAEVLAADPVARPVSLGTEGGEADVLRVRRLRLLDGAPAALEEIWLDMAGAAQLTAADLSESLYLTCQRELGVTVERTEDRVGLSSVPDWGHGQLAIAPGAVCGHVRRRGWAGGRVLEVSETWFDTDRAQFVSRMR
ncbi:MAG: GntR family transcriptional regulator [Pseudomonadota bacterium]